MRSVGAPLQPAVKASATNTQASIDALTGLLPHSVGRSVGNSSEQASWQVVTFVASIVRMLRERITDSASLTVRTYCWGFNAPGQCARADDLVPLGGTWPRTSAAGATDESSYAAATARRNRISASSATARTSGEDSRATANITRGDAAETIASAPS